MNASDRRLTKTQTVASSSESETANKDSSRASRRITKTKDISIAISDKSSENIQEPVSAEESNKSAVESSVEEPASAEESNNSAVESSEEMGRPARSTRTKQRQQSTAVVAPEPVPRPWWP